MKLLVNIKPSVVKGEFIDSVKNRVTDNSYYVISNNVNGYVNSSCNKVVAFNIVKKNAIRKRNKDGKYIKVKSAEVTAYVYRFDLELLRALKLKVTQKNRNFKLEKM